jgi:hypothetical protein
MDTLKAKRASSNGFHILKDHDTQPRLIYHTKLYAVIEGESFHDINNLTEFISTKPTLKETKEAIYQDEEGMSMIGKLWGKYEFVIIKAQNSIENTLAPKFNNMATGANTHFSVITLNISGFSPPTKRHRLVE